MKPKTILTAVLGLFVVASVVYLVAGETRREAPVAEPGPAAADADDAPRNAIVAYYFHTTRRCPTCRKIEEYAREAIETGFADEVREGRIVWRVVNVEEAGNEHFVDEYRLTTKSVVLSEIVDGEEKRWTNLPRVWDLVGDKAAFISYVQGEVKGFERGGS